jgi:hypothetical protein
MSSDKKREGNQCSQTQKLGANKTFCILDRFMKRIENGNSARKSPFPNQPFDDPDLSGRKQYLVLYSMSCRAAAKTFKHA